MCIRDSHVGSEIPVIPYYRPGSPELAKAVVEAMLEHNSVLLTNHGPVSYTHLACFIVNGASSNFPILT